MLQEKINELLEYCKTQDYYARIHETGKKNLKKIHISNKYLQKLNLKVIDDDKIRILSHENNRFSQEITKFLEKQQINIIPYHFDAVILTDKSEHPKSIEDDNDNENPGNCIAELQHIIHTLDTLSANDEVKIYTRYKGVISILKNPRQIRNKYAGTPYESIYNTIKEKQLFVHFEWVKGGLKKTKKGNNKPKISKKLLIK